MSTKKSKNNTPVFDKLNTPNQNVENIISNSDLKSNYLPKTIKIEDIDQGVNDLFQDNNDFQLVLDDEVNNRETVPAFFMSNERWAEFNKTWIIIDQDKNVSFPIVTIFRKPEMKKGTYAGEKYSIPNRPVFTYLKVPTYEDGFYGYDMYQIPQPVAIDITYEVRLFTKYTQDVNKFVEMFLTNFNSLQYYINVNGHYFRIIMEETFGDEGTMEEIEGDRYHVPLQTFTVKGYIQDEKHFKLVKSYSRLGIKYFNKLANKPL